MRDSILPLLSPAVNNRSSQIRWNFFRFVFRRKLRFYLLAFAILSIFLITLLHKYSISSDTRYNNDKHHQDEQHKSKLSKKFGLPSMKTIVGKYVGPKPIWSENYLNVSEELKNSNNYNPIPSAGEDGRPTYVENYPKDQMQLLYSINRFNLVASDRISVDRKLPDPRKLACRKKHYNNRELGNTSVIIVFHNEAWSTLVRTVHSILNTTPQSLLDQILLVDDASNRTFLGKSLEYYMNNLGSIRGVNIDIIRSSERIGLIKARLLGVEKARGKVLTFIDAHCEATIGWLEPLLEQIKLDRKSAACPIIDIINEENFAFTRSFELHLGAFNWGLNFRWYPISRRELIESNGFRNKQESKVKITELIHPFSSPVMAGGLFSIEKDYFNEIGKYDPEMDIWGGENIELSLRLWQCGGKVKIVPCSHVAHIFRKSSPYTFRPGKEVSDILYTNLARVAEVWMDDWKEFFYKLNPIVNKTLHKVGHYAAFKNINSRHELRMTMQCKSFSWFLDNIWPEHFFPKHDRFFGRLQHQSNSLCLQRPTVRIGMGQAAVGAVETANCTSGLSPSFQLFNFNPSTGFLSSDENLCLDSGSKPIATRQVILAPCTESKRQKWEYTKENTFRHVSSNLCLDSPNERRVQLMTCFDNQRIDNLKWKFIREIWY